MPRKKNIFEKMEEAAGIKEIPQPEPEKKPGEYFKAPEYQGPAPWRKKPEKKKPEWYELESSLTRRSTAGSKPFTKEELKQGYRKVEGGNE